jgi:hypothetical protein
MDGPGTSRTDVTQRTNDGYSRDASHALPMCQAHIRSVDATCDEDVGKCVRQVEVDKQP